MDALGAAFGASRACFTRMNAVSLRTVATVRGDELNHDARALAAMLNDPVSKAAAAMPLGMVFQRKAITDIRFRRRELWNDWLKPRDMHDSLMARLPGGGDSELLLAIDRHDRHPFGAAESRLLATLVPHVTRAGMLGQQVQQLNAISRFANHASACVLVDAALRIVLANPAAECQAEQVAGGFTLAGDGLRLADPFAARRLAQLVGAATGSGAMPPQGGTVMARVAEGGEPGLVATVLPFARSEAFGLPLYNLAMVVLRPLPNEDAEVLQRQVSAAFDLSPAEARLASSLATGRSPAEVALSGDIAVGTCLERVYRKTGTNHHDQLVALLKSLDHTGSPEAEAEPA